MPLKKRLPPINQLQGVLIVLDKQKSHLSANDLASVKGMVQDALEILKEPDREKQHVSFVLLAIQQSTEVVEKVIRGKLITRVKIVDLHLYNWAMAEIHNLVRKLK